jgi:flagellar assembly protein FliH
MPTVIRATDRARGTSNVDFNFDDMTSQARRYLDGVRADAARIVAAAQEEAAAIRSRAAEEGRQTAANMAIQAAEHTVEKQLNTALPALRRAIQDIEHAKQAWLAHWEASAVRLETAIAARVVRGELRRQPEIPLALVREALQLAAGSDQIHVHLNPGDHKALQSQVAAIVGEIARLGATEIIADPSVTPGGCRVETRFGTIDQQFETQLARIEEELTQ